GAGARRRALAARTDRRRQGAGRRAGCRADGGPGRPTVDPRRAGRGAAGDQVGVLCAIATALYHLGLSIHLAKISTSVDRVLDVFYVTDEDGRKVEDRSRLALIRDTRLAE